MAGLASGVGAPEIVRWQSLIGGGRLLRGQRAPRWCERLRVRGISMAQRFEGEAT